MHCNCPTLLTQKIQGWLVTGGGVEPAVPSVMTLRASGSVTYNSDSATLKTHFNSTLSGEVSLTVLGIPDSWRVLFVLLLWPIPHYIVIICVFLCCLNHWLLKARDCIVLLFFWNFVLSFHISLGEFSSLFWLFVPLHCDILEMLWK